MQQKYENKKYSETNKFPTNYKKRKIIIITSIVKVVVQFNESNHNIGKHKEIIGPAWWL